MEKKILSFNEKQQFEQLAEFLKDVPLKKVRQTHHTSMIETSCGSEIHTRRFVGPCVFTD